VISVMIPTDDRSFGVNFLDGYSKIGCTPYLGTANFFCGAIRPNVIHVLWPEELSGWRRPSESWVEDFARRLSVLREHSIIVFSVNNIYPHGQYRDPQWHRVYSVLFDLADVIHHYSKASIKLVAEEYPAFRDRNHVVTTGFNYERVRRLRSMSRKEARSKYGFKDDDIVYLIFGAIRFSSEWMLLQNAWQQSSLHWANRRLLLVCRYNPDGRRILRWIRSKAKYRWVSKVGAVLCEDYIAEDAIPAVFDAADIVVVLRSESLSSGIPPLAMTLGKYVIAPDLHAIAEYVSFADNGIYKPGCCDALAAQIDRAAQKDVAKIGRNNESVALEWSWESTVKSILEAVPPARAGLLRSQN
jgi:hypothetical protein